MTDIDALNGLLQLLDNRAKAGNPTRFWLRDDDAAQPDPALDHLLDLTASYDVPLTLAVIPATTGEALSQRLSTEPHVSVAVHGWSHSNHAPADEKKQELGHHRPAEVVTKELSDGLNHLAALYPDKFVPLLVPPWNRIAPEVVAALPSLEFRALSVFGPAREGALPMINTHVDLIDWKGTRGGRPAEMLLSEIIDHLQSGDIPLGILTHHLVHDVAAWRFLEQLFAATAKHPGCRWLRVSELIG
ncbi:polysaccharide deacetylase family protein [Aliiroseovarius sp. YM-037]|uniref:polysaccharide deacetylase family protein n=1 Tax=Aliiroseovarius sp. YM-037 TaxID=3341728 RepID=UPI003A8114FB